MEPNFRHFLVLAEKLNRFLVVYRRVIVTELFSLLKYSALYFKYLCGCGVALSRSVCSFYWHQKSHSFCRSGDSDPSKQGKQ
jgi:hypothetical protein